MTLIVVHLFFLGFLAVAAAEFDSKLTGTWSTKSRKVVTGPDFYDPSNDRLLEPTHAGISYSFTDDGHYESAYYRAISNPVNPACPKSVMQFQHGTYMKVSNGSLILTPFAEDGRQLISNPCKNKLAEYYRYNQTEIFKRYEVLKDPYHNVQRLNLFRFDGSPMHPMFLVMKPPQMLPTSTLNPISTATGTATTSRNTKFKRDGGSGEVMIVEPLNKRAIVKRRDPSELYKWWWIGVVMTSLGGLMLVYSSK